MFKLDREINTPHTITVRSEEECFIVLKYYGYVRSEQFSRIVFRNDVFDITLGIGSGISYRGDFGFDDLKYYKDKYPNVKNYNYKEWLEEFGIHPWLGYNIKKLVM